MINRNAYHNAMRCGTLLSAPRPDAQHLATPLIATQRFVCFITPLLGLPLRPSTLLNDLFVISATQLCESHLYAVQRYSTQLYSSPRMAPQLNSTICLSSTRRIDTRLSAPQLSATICLLSSPLFELHLFEPRLDAAHCASTRRHATHLHSTQRFVCYQRSASPLGYPPRTAPRLRSTPLNDLFVYIASQLDNARRNATQLHSTICLFLRFSPHRSASRLIAPRRCAPQHHSTICLLSSHRHSTRQYAAKRYSTQRNQPIGELNVPKITSNHKNMRHVS